MFKIPLLLIVASLAATVTTSATAAGPYTNYAHAMVREAIPSIQAYWADHNTYVGISLAKLRSLDRTVSSIEIAYARKNTFCVQASVLGFWYHIAQVSSTAYEQGLRPVKL